MCVCWLTTERVIRCDNGKLGDVLLAHQWFQVESHYVGFVGFFSPSKNVRLKTQQGATFCRGSVIYYHSKGQMQNTMR